MYQVCLDAGMNVTLAQCEYILGASDVSADEPHAAMARLGLQLVQEEIAL
jgi:hypothetical protein